jgi:uncharacterized damage-inducible protein DinB
MGMSSALLPEFDQEMANTRKTLSRAPDEQFGWKPHEKSLTLGSLVTHLANIPTWAIWMLEGDCLDVAPGGVPVGRIAPAKSQSEALETFDKNVAAARAAIAGANDEQLRKPWSLLSNGKTIFTLPRIAVLRSFVMNHSIHHRAQLGVYLRLNDVPVPALYGPSADEGAF